MLSKTATNYQLLLNNVKQLIDISGYTDEYLSKQLGLTLSRFCLKKQKKGWSVEEVIKLLEFIESEKTQDFIDVVKMKKISSEGKFISSDKFEKQMGWERY